MTDGQCCEYVRKGDITERERLLRHDAFWTVFVQDAVCICSSRCDSFVDDDRFAHLRPGVPRCCRVKPRFLSLPSMPRPTKCFGQRRLAPVPSCLSTPCARPFSTGRVV